MTAKTLFAVSTTVLGLAALTGAIALAREPKEKDSAEKQEPRLPPGWTPADMAACQHAATPGKMHELLSRDAGVWQGKNTMWLAPGAEPVTTECTNTTTVMMGGRFIRCEMTGEMPGMGPYNGLAISGYDNVSKKLFSTWIDNCGTGLASGEGELSADGKTLTWKYSYNCPIRKKPAVLRQVETMAGGEAKTVELFTADPKSGKEYKMMRIELARKK